MRILLSSSNCDINARRIRAFYIIGALNICTHTFVCVHCTSYFVSVLCILVHVLFVCECLVCEGGGECVCEILRYNNIPRHTVDCRIIQVKCLCNCVNVMAVFVVVRH